MTPMTQTLSVRHWPSTIAASSALPTTCPAVEIGIAIETPNGLSAENWPKEPIVQKTPEHRPTSQILGLNAKASPAFGTV